MNVIIGTGDLPAEIFEILEGQTIAEDAKHMEVYILDTLIGYTVTHRDANGVEFVSNIVNGDGGLYEDDRAESVCIRCGAPSAGHDCSHGEDTSC